MWNNLNILEGNTSIKSLTVCAYGVPLNIKDNLSHSILESENLTYIELGLNNIGDNLITALGKVLA